MYSPADIFFSSVEHQPLALLILPGTDGVLFRLHGILHSHRRDTESQNADHAYLLVILYPDRLPDSPGRQRMALHPTQEPQSWSVVIYVGKIIIKVQ